MEFLKIILLAIVAAILYGLVHDRVTVFRWGDAAMGRIACGYAAGQKARIPEDDYPFSSGKRFGQLRKSWGARPGPKARYIPA